VTKRLHRYYGTHDLHFITSSCYHRLPELGSAWRRDLFVKILEEARRKYRFVVHGYVVMPEHFHLLITEPEVGDPSVVMKVIKERFSRQVNRKRKQAAVEQGVLWEQIRKPVWQKRFYDFNVWNARKQIEKLRYMHRNPVKRGLVERPEQWKWSSFRAYFYGETGPVRVKSQEWELEIKRRPVQSFAEVESPLIHKVRECVGHPANRVLSPR
jgi:putative transposase